MHTLFLAVITVASLYCTTTEASFKVTPSTISLSKYQKTYKNKKSGAAHIHAQDLPAIGNLLRDQGVSQVWISHFNGKQYEEYELTVKMVPAEGYRRVFEEHLWLNYGPEPNSFIYKNRAAVLIPAVVSMASDRAEDKKLHGLYWSDEEDEETEESVVCSRVRVSPLAARRRQTRNPQRASVNLTSVPHSEATVIIRNTENSPRHHTDNSPRSPSHQRRAAQHGSPPLTIRPVFNPPQGPAPSQAFVDQRTGDLPPNGATIFIPRFTTDGPLSPRVGQTSPNRKEQKRGDQDEY